MTNIRTRYILHTTAGNRYELDAQHNVVARSNGPQGWDYSGKWRILGAATRWNSNAYVTLDAIANYAEPFGHGYVVDVDHGTVRRWGSERLARVEVVSR